MDNVTKPWPALWALVLGFFMILIDTTIVSVANPSIMKGLDADINSVIWVTSAYLLAYAVPLLITGRLGDRFGPKNIYLGGLALFTLASAWCGLSGDIHTLIVARVFQGLGAALMTPQTMAVITRIFPPDRRGTAMGLWGSVAGVAMLVGPILGGVLVDGLGWEWIFFVNVPVGVVAFVMAVRLVPKLTTRPHRFDIFGVVLSAIGMFLVVFGIQEGETYDWGTIVGPISVWSLIIAGIVVLAGFVVWQRYNRGEPLLPLHLFTDRNFSLANVGITTVGFTVTCMGLPLMFYTQIVLGWSPTESALLMIPMAVISGGAAPLVGKIVNKVDSRFVAVPGLLGLSAALFWLGSQLTPGADWWQFIPALCLLGASTACVWSPLSVSATRNLPQSQAGAGAGVYNTTRQIGSVLGSACIAMLMEARLAAELPGFSAQGAEAPQGASLQLPEQLQAGFAAAMGQSLILPAATAIVGAIAVVFFAKPKQTVAWGVPTGAVPVAAASAPADPASAAKDPAPAAEEQAPVAGVGPVAGASAPAGASTEPLVERSATGSAEPARHRAEAAD